MWKDERFALGCKEVEASGLNIHYRIWEHDSFDRCPTLLPTRADRKSTTFAKRQSVANAHFLMNFQQQEPEERTETLLNLFPNNQMPHIIIKPQDEKSSSYKFILCRQAVWAKRGVFGEHYSVFVCQMAFKNCFFPYTFINLLIHFSIAVSQPVSIIWTWIL